MIKTQEQKELERLAREIGKKDKRLSWPSCLDKARQAQRRFGRR